MSKTVFIVALPEETGLVSDILGHPIIYSGVGKINATMAAYRAFSEGYKQVINIGSCGSLKHSAGTVIKVGAVFQDIDGTPLCEYGETPFEAKGNNKQIVLDRKLQVWFTCFTTDYFYDHNQIDKYSSNYLEMVNSCSILDMECYALAKVCKRFNLQFSSYKWVSDDGDGGDWAENCQIGLNKVIQILKNEDISNW